MGIGCSLLLVDGFRGASGAGADDGTCFWGDVAVWPLRLGGLSIRLLFAACRGRRDLGADRAGAGAMWAGGIMDIGFSKKGSWKTCIPSFGMKY